MRSTTGVEGAAARRNMMSWMVQTVAARGHARAIDWYGKCTRSQPYERAIFGTTSCSQCGNERALHSHDLDFGATERAKASAGCGTSRTISTPVALVLRAWHSSRT